jgi:DNA-binding phage protein
MPKKVLLVSTNTKNASIIELDITVHSAVQLFRKKDRQPNNIQHKNMNKTKRPSEVLETKFLTGLAILEGLENNNPDAVIVAIANYLKTRNKTKTAKKGNIARSTLYLNMSQGANPTLKTLAKVVYACAHEGA